MRYSLKTSSIKAALKRKGFIERDGDHHYYVYCIDGKKTSIFTKISHSSDEISDTLISAMARQTRLTKPKFTELVNCTLSEEDYRRMMIDEGNVILNN